MLGIFLATVVILSAMVLGNAWLEARREVCIEGPFGWSSLTFTTRYKPDSFLGRLFQLVVGKDKAPTEYHLVSAGLWLLMYLPALPLTMMYCMLIGIYMPAALANVFAMIVACFVLTMIAEDYLWFMVHPYYGPLRFSARYIPWIQSYKGGLQTSYLYSMGFATLLVAVTSIATGMYASLLLWLGVMGLVILATALIRQREKKMPRKDLPEYWWKDWKYILIVRCPYPTEGRQLDLATRAYAVSDEGLEKLVSVRGGWISLDQTK